ncbi:hypothetical protein [Piscinibacter sp. HJYY11]|uniref:hypothetical protein n=1 Tax=Piscinibacter sp. HJYY11 TaxID=2801333 RepID=UPI00191EE90F|nr:hypothetical protein [Piscinibacter sp. HJYY11]MBL0726807.1 hypothetical protein [Piscinibacter sp. HJYY11]
MKTLLPLYFMLAIGSAAHAAMPADGAKAADSCEAAVTDTIKEMRGRNASDVQFNKEKRVLSPTTGEETDIKGAGRYRNAAGAATPFTYGCAYNDKTGATSGIVFRDAAGPRASEEKEWQPDLLSVSPEACETAVAATLKSKHPRVGRIAFGSDSRQLRPAPGGRASLEGIGAVQRAPGMNLVQFNYRCEFEPGNGKLVAVQAFE